MLYINYTSIQILKINIKIRKHLQTQYSPKNKNIRPDYAFCMRKVKVLVCQLCPTLCKSMDHSLPVSSVHGILQQEYQNGLPFPSPGDFPDPEIKPRSPALHSLLSEPPRTSSHEKLILIFFFLATPCSLQDVSSLTRN